VSDKEILAQWMMQHGYATGHGDTIEGLLVELDIQIVENWTRALVKGVQGEREACAKVCDEKVEAEYATGKVDHNEMGWTQACAITIRARGQG